MPRLYNGVRGAAAAYYRNYHYYCNYDDCPWRVRITPGYIHRLFSVFPCSSFSFFTFTLCIWRFIYRYTCTRLFRISLCARGQSCILFLSRPAQFPRICASSGFSFHHRRKIRQELCFFSRFSRSNIYAQIATSLTRNVLSVFYRTFYVIQAWSFVVCFPVIIIIWPKFSSIFRFAM